MEALAIALSTFLGALLIFQALLAFGLPMGKAAWGGQHKVLPKKLRVASAVAAAVFAFSILVVLTGAGIIEFFGHNFVKVYFWILTIYFGIGIIMNAVSRSKIERLWAPIIAVMFVLSLLILLRV